VAHRPRAAVNEAQQRKLPLMVYVLASSSDRDDDIERDQRRALRDDRVQWYAERFIPLRLSRSVHRDILGDFGLPQHANMMMSFVSPDGKVLGTIGAGGVAQADSLVEKLRRVFDQYTQYLFKEHIQPVLKDEKASVATLLEALEAIVTFDIQQADSAVIELLDRERLEPRARDAIYTTLARLGTEAGVKKLWEVYEGGDKRAIAALQDSTPAAAALLIEKLKAAPEEFDYDLYKALTGMTGMRKTKPERWFENATQPLIERHIAEVRDHVERAAQAYKERQDALR
jgi:hypothetical protein